MKRFLSLTLMAALMVVSFGAVRTAAVGMEVPAENIDADYGGELLDEPLWEINFFLNGQLMYGAVAEESLVSYTQDTINEMMMETWGGYHTESECFYDDLIINIYYEVNSNE